jgi:hypothetical protein
VRPASAWRSLQDGANNDAMYLTREPIERKRVPAALTAELELRLVQVGDTQIAVA